MKARAWLVLAAAVPMLGGCALTFSDSDGYEHSFGLVHQKVKTTDQLVYLEKRTLGLNLNLAGEDAGTTLGYKNSVRVFVPEDSVLILDRDEGQLRATLGQLR